MHSVSKYMSALLIVTAQFIYADKFLHDSCEVRQRAVLRVRYRSVDVPWKHAVT
jgi:hypothetical protein